MDLNNYAIVERDGVFAYVYMPTVQTLLTTQFVSLDTLMRLAVVDHANRNRISL